MPQIAIAALDDLRRRQSVKFKFRRDGISRDGFAALVQGQVIVYENVGDGKQIICKTHGAVYEPLTGLCTEGPCRGASLFKIPFEVRDGKVWTETEE
jgi:nitrite reductase/ring-hydroxylating ferredoxin subunit